MGADINVRLTGADFWRSLSLTLTTILLLGFSGHSMAVSKIYFTEAGPTVYNLQRANTDGTSLEDIVSDDGANNVHEDMFVDVKTNGVFLAGTGVVASVHSAEGVSTARNLLVFD